MHEDKPLYLGSGSPRRRQLLSECGYRFDVLVPGVEEIPSAGLAAEEIPEDLARQKALHLSARITVPDYTLLTADTVVILDGEIIGKPLDKQDAADILSRLSGRRHDVVSGVCLAGRGFLESFSDTTRVTFGRLTPSEISWYVENFDVLDKAGAYAIQEWIGLIGIPAIEGSYYNVMGLPIHRVYERLSAHGIFPRPA